jgi:putative flippase GtrA
VIKIPTLSSLPQFVRFSIVGAIGFVVDTGVLYGAIYLFNTGPYIGRLVSYLVAASSTWYLNRLITFPDRRGGHKGKEWLKFVACSALGGVVNYSAYALYLRFAGASLATPVIGVGIGACAGLFVNYTLSRHVVFNTPRVAPASTP